MKNVYYFGDGKAEGAAEQKNKLGGLSLIHISEPTRLGMI